MRAFSTFLLARSYARNGPNPNSGTKNHPQKFSAFIDLQFIQIIT